jgi:methyl-accepting chemotaxis protein
MADHVNGSGPANREQAATNRRRRLLINPASQRRFIMSISVPTLVMLLAVGAWASWLESVAFDDVATSGETDMTGALPFGVGMFFALLVFAGTVVVQALRVSHRVEGSAYRIVKSMQRIRQGDLAFTVKLRKKDHLQEVADELNELMAWIRTQLPSPSAASAAAGSKPAAAVQPLSAAVGEGR